MSGGIAYVYDKNDNFETRFNSELCDMKETKLGSEDDKILNKLVKKHLKKLDSPLAKKCLTTGQMFFQNLKKSYQEIMKKLLKN